MFCYYACNFYAHLHVISNLYASFSKNYSYDENSGMLVDPVFNMSFDADPENESNPAYSTFQSEIFARKWIACCRAAIDCCSIMIAEPETGLTSGMYINLLDLSF